MAVTFEVAEVELKSIANRNALQCATGFCYCMPLPAVDDLCAIGYRNALLQDSELRRSLPCHRQPQLDFSSTSARSKCGSGSQANLASHVPKACAHVLLGMAVTFEVAVLAIESNAMVTSKSMHTVLCSPLHCAHLARHAATTTANSVTSKSMHVVRRRTQRRGGGGGVEHNTVTFEVQNPVAMHFCLRSTSARLQLDCAHLARHVPIDLSQ